MHSTDLDLNGKQIGELSSPDGLARFFEKLGYSISARTPLTPESIGLSGDSATAFRKIERLSKDDEDFLHVVFAQPKSLTAKARTDLVRVLGKGTTDYLLVLASDYETLEFVLLDKRKREQQGPGGVERVQVIPKTISVSRRTPTRLDLRTIRRFTWTSRDAIDQFDKLRSVFDAAVYTGEYFQNRGLFADYFLRDRLREDVAWRDNPAEMFAFVLDLYKDSQTKWHGKDKEAMRGGLFKPVFERLGFKPVVNRPSKTDQTQPDYLLKDTAGRVLSAAFVYQWDRWLDGPDQNDPDTPEENPGACVVSALDQGQADWVVVTNGRLWRLYSRQAHARSTNFYEVDLVEALTASGETDPNEAFRYFWLFFRIDAFRPQNEATKVCWLDAILLGSREYAKRLGERLKERVFVTIFPHLAEGFLADRRQRLGKKTEPTPEELDDIFEATLTFLYRLLFLLYAESRDLLPVREAPYLAASLKMVKEEIAKKAGVARDAVPGSLEKAYSAKDTALYDALGHLFEAMDRGDPALNVPTYNGGLFITKPGDLERREHRIAKFLLDHKVPDRHLALAIDLLARDQDEKSFSLAFIDYKSLEVRHLGSIYEGLLEFKLKIAPEDLTTQTDAKNAKVERYVALSQVKGGKPKRNGPGVVVKKGDVYLSNSKAERKASGSYYTPDPIVEYIVANAVGPVLDAKLAALEPEFRKVRKTFNNELQKSESYPSAEVRTNKMDHRQWAGLKTYLAHQDLVEKFFDLKVVDPAMGSGHFLVEAVDYVTDRLLKFLNQFPINPVNFALDKTRTSILESLGEQGVTVDPTKLTDINLLKRHVLKRCIYGVDLNPMAVELAKVSLWLDAFTLGAPLSFLDHHLRCGNSLVGASYRDLKKATGTLWALNTEPLLRAIQHVLFVSKMSDATAAEATQSADRFTQARKALSGYRIIFDCLTAQDFGEPNAKSIIECGQEFDLTNRELFLKSVSDPDDRALIDSADALSHRPEHRFFYWDIEFPEVFFGFRDNHERQPEHRDELKPGTAGFDVVIGNPPYDVLAEKELGADLEHLLAYFKKEKTYEPACKDKQNLYKLFICRGVQLLRTGGRIGHIVPMPLLGDEQSVGVRKMLLNKTALVLVEAFPQKDDPKNRVFEDAKLSTCVFVTEKSDQDRQFRSRVHPGKSIEEDSPSLLIRRSMVKLYDPENQPIVACSQEDWDLAAKIMSGGRMKRLSDYCKAYQGEVNETNDREKGHISYKDSAGPPILRGANVTLYALRPSSQGEAIFMLRDKFLDGKKKTSKAWHHEQYRVGFQRKAPQNNFRRLIACRIPKGEFCCESISYFPEKESLIPLNLIVALMNSKLLDWFFRLGSTNAMVNDYQIRILPAPACEKSGVALTELPDFAKAVESNKWGVAFDLVTPLLSKPPFPNSVMWCLVKLVESITAIEAKRGDITRSERSALDPKAQPYQDLLDKIIYRMAGLTDEEAAGLEGRLATML